MSENLVAQADVTIDAPAGEVWQALLSPDAIKQYMFGTTVESQWTEGSRITWNGEWKGETRRRTPNRTGSGCWTD
jgi:uncharacterized protein YndB with AHSA1/START domain